MPEDTVCRECVRVVINPEHCIRPFSPRFCLNFHGSTHNTLLLSLQMSGANHFWRQFIFQKDFSLQISH